MKFTVLVDNTTSCGHCNAEWGLSLLIESCGHKILFDTGMSDMFWHNACNMGIDLSDAEALVISHGHYDHTGGVEKFVEINENAPIYLHREAIAEMHGVTDGVMDDENCGILWSEEFIGEIQDRLVRTHNTLQLFDNIWLSGDIPLQEGFTPSEVFYRFSNGIQSADEMNHEQILIVEEDGKLFIFSGCSHKGVVSILEHVKQLFPEKKIEAMIAGLHLFSLSDEALSDFLKELDKYQLNIIGPMHCTGMNAIVAMREKFKERCLLLSSGRTVSL